MDELYKDLLEDSKHQRMFFTKLVIVLVFIIILCIGGLIGLSMYYQNKLTTFISETEFDTDYYISTDNQSSNNGSISVSK